MSAQPIEVLKKFFTISCAMFDMQRTILNAINPERVEYMSSMESLHRIALAELNKEVPNMPYLSYLIANMEDLADKNKVSNV